MTLSILVLALVTLQRLGELLLSARNTSRLKARGAYEVGRSHYPLLVALHAAWLAALWLLGWDRPASLSWLGLYLVLQALRAWVLVTLGPRWTTRIIVLPGAPLVDRGPYRFISHPNYAVVVGEIFVLPMVFGLVEAAIVFTLVNALVLFVRIRSENAALGAAER
jgi:methyltransferase